ncbi:MAG TPA: GNAT family N-acetyltransferase, partial [Candidatus Cloacimonadota bacterium]|nr:GNAT family N-acetyltransferase [Candidatus Cloacimonadota bacterium]
KNLQYETILDVEPVSEKEVPQAPADEKLTLRLMRPEEADQMAKCIYHSYGYTYAWEFIYYPEKVKELFASGLLTSCIFLNSANEIVGHFALLRNNKDDLVGESGMAVTDPRYRGRGLFKQMKSFLAEHARNMGMRGFYSEAVAMHPYSQKGNLALGAHESGVVLGMIPATIYFKKIQDMKAKKRQPAVFFYYKLQDGPSQKIYAPVHHHSIIEKIYKMNALERTIADLKDSIKPELPAQSLVNVVVKTEVGFAILQVEVVGEDFMELIKYRLRELCLRQVSCIYIDLNLTDPATRRYCASLEMLGFFFAGVIPEMPQGDVLRLQYLNNVNIDLDEIVTASEFGEELANYVRQAYKSMLTR